MRRRGGLLPLLLLLGCGPARPPDPDAGADPGDDAGANPGWVFVVQPGADVAVVDDELHRLRLRFAVASDLHYGQLGGGVDDLRQLTDLVAWLNLEQRELGLDLVILNGDLCNGESLGPRACVEVLQEQLGELAAPFWVVKGNHDHLDERGTLLGWEQLWGHPANFSLVVDDHAFVLCDTTAPAASGEYLPADRAWLADELTGHAARTAIFVFMHIAQRDVQAGEPLWPRFGVGHRAGGGFDPARAQAGAEVMALLEATPRLRAVFHGHNHDVTARYLSGDTPYFFDGRVGGSWGTTPGYRIVELYADGSGVSYYVAPDEGTVRDEQPL